ncbi:ABC transporter ATP-binding protein [Devosia sp. RR2S18]|uniref:ABC transporter ATP-binding protein n=1 Tax=Devosia rhizosphaerae TaxID=3049774 RepID=UPI00253FFE3C|nr:ABC transporter ATP-binding protein [Devosia sp. RR2S18]WIJ25817.1 ABC transporter ATP-binding protein [Devosia sp. RR2S18]
MIDTHPAISIRNVSRLFRRRDGGDVIAARDISMDIPRGQFVCLVGPSGCGKTTMLQMLAGLLSPSGGEILVDGAPVSGPGPDRGVVFQKDSVFPWMSVIDNVEYGLKSRGVPAAERRERARRYLASVGLSEVENAWPRELSGGMLKRVAIATVFANGSRVLLLDEPFGALDYVTKHQLHDVLLSLWAEDGEHRTVVFVTHDIDEALLLADRVLVFKSGDVAADLAVNSARPRSTDSLLEAEMVDHKHSLLGHIGLGPASVRRSRGLPE